MNIQEITEYGIKYYTKQSERGGDLIFREVNNIINNDYWILVITNVYPSGRVKIINKLLVEVYPRANQDDPLFN